VLGVRTASVLALLTTAGVFGAVAALFAAPVPTANADALNLALGALLSAYAGREQLLAFTRFLQSGGLDRPLREGRWADFARGYNGAAYARHAYDQRLKAAFAAETARA
jgi:hypothetical protein